MAATRPSEIGFSSGKKSRIKGRGIFHFLLAVLTWILFFFWWNQVTPLISPRDAAAALFVICLTALLTSVLTLLWVRYNVGIYRRKGPRKNLPDVSEERDTDYLGRPLVHPGCDHLKKARVVLISREGDQKIFEIRRTD